MPPAPSADEISRKTALETAHRAADTAAETAASPEKEQRSPQGASIGFVEAGLMIGVALFFDILQIALLAIGIGLVIGPVISAVAWLTFFLWFHAKGLSSPLSFRGGAKAILKNPVAVNLVTLAAETVGFNLLLFERTVGTAFMIGAIWAERTASIAGVNALARRGRTV